MRGEVSEALVGLMSNWIYYDSLMTNHNYNRSSSAYCTDFAIGYLGIINESLLFSDTGKIEILPAVPETGFESGSIKGLRARTNALVDDISWNLEEGTASVTVTSDISQTVEISCGLSDKTQTVTLSPGQTVTVTFELD